jgi:hypothetical protein
MKDYDYQAKGTIELCNPDSFPELTTTQKMNGHAFEDDFQLQTSSDGRVWINVRGVCLLRFKPSGNPSGDNTWRKAE